MRFIKNKCITQMNVQELRIGNMCYSNLETIKNSIAIVIPTDLTMAKDDTIKHLLPVPITDELLVEFGWVSVSPKEMYHPDTLLFELYKPFEDFGYYRATRKDSNGSRLILSQRLMYIHTLQNLWFTMHGSEMTHKSKGTPPAN